MANRIDELIQTLNLWTHPEGGYYSETYKNPEQCATARGKRCLSTSIYFLLTSENHSHFHQLKSDEVWLFHEGSPLTIHILNEDGYKTLLLGPADGRSQQPQQLVRAGDIFGATVEADNSFTLVSCISSPGFDFEDFRLLGTEELLAQFPQQHDIIQRLSSSSPVGI
ncbi:MAG: cupin domain-containing protein [Bacteroidales bacterium]